MTVAQQKVFDAMRKHGILTDDYYDLTKQREKARKEREQNIRVEAWKVKKKKIIVESCEKYDTFNMEPIDVLAHVGGLDIACMVGMYIGAARYRKPMLVDGFISSVAALAACKIEPKIKDYIIATHMSEEPGMELVLKELGEEAFFNMKMRLGEGTGAVLAYPIIDCAIEVINGMKTPTAVYELFL